MKEPMQLKTSRNRCQISCSTGGAAACFKSIHNRERVIALQCGAAPPFGVCIPSNAGSIYSQMRVLQNPTSEGIMLFPGETERYPNSRLRVCL